MRFSKRKLFFFVFVFFYAAEGQSEKMGKGPKPYKNSVFKAVIQNEKNLKKGFIAKLRDAICVRKGERKRAFSCTLSVLAKTFWAQNSRNHKKNYKIVVATETA